ncbi:Nucleoside-triphosphatase THEP1 [Diplonema papillatum]|nr:Nucleoside-triphosphatase THEP1 [Diplonema papillatum]
MNRIRPILITGTPGVGKTTVFKKICENLKKSGADVTGFYTEEERGPGGGRVGFDIVPVSPDGLGKTSVLARLTSETEDKRLPTVGRWSVYVPAFEAAALPLLVGVSDKQPGEPATVLVIDEIGKMELLSADFGERLATLLRRPPVGVLIVATVALRGSGLVASAKELPSVDVYEVTADNRDEMAPRLTTVASHRLRNLSAVVHE